MSDKQQITEELLLQAFQYVSGELSEQQVDVFEQRMQTDDIVCEAVAEATHLSSLVAGCPVARDASGLQPVAQTHGTASPNARSVAAVTAVCCCLGLLLTVSSGVWLADESTSDVELTGVVDAGNYTDAEQLVSTWIESIEPNTRVDSEPSDSFSGELSVPDWMLAAVTLADIETRNGSNRSTDGSNSDDVELF